MVSKVKACMHKSILITVLCLMCSSVHADSPRYADEVLVIKSQRKMFLLAGGKVLKQYPVMLGLQPVGHKLEKGDNRTPEGRYLLQGRNPQSKFHRSIHITYPNEADLQRAQARGVDPGGYIAIHGLPVQSEEAVWDFVERDWTNGCIAVTNPAIEEIWELVKDGTPIEIRP